nr:hypothetical protein [uncultured Fluviicola sp.]
MNKSYYIIPLIFLLQGVFLSCNTNQSQKKELSKEEGSVQKTDSSFVRKKSVYDDLLKKFKKISFDTLMVEYHYDTKDKRYRGTELTLKEAKSLNIEYTEPSYGKLSGVFACYQFQIDSIRTGLIARIPAEYESTSIGLFILDNRKDKIESGSFHLGAIFGDAGDAYQRISWLFRTKNNQFHSFVYDYSSYNHEVEDTSDHTIEKWTSYFLIDCMTPKFDTVSKDETQLKKRFKRVLKKVE